jgi:alpha-glucosidase
MPDDRWWQDGVLYQIYPRSFADSNGDGVGDIRGIIQRLDYLRWLGIDGVWINPVMDSPNADWGYDVADYKAVHPELGTLEDVDELVAEAGKRGIRIIFDIVPNHTSDQHAWFQDALKARNARYRDWYVWADSKPDGSPPNNWQSVFGGERAWEYHEPTGQFYLHNFLKQQPDLNWWNDEVREEFDDILRFWFDRGVAGFRIDVAHALVKDQELRDNLPATDDDPERIRQIGQRAMYNMNRPEVHEVYRRWRKLCDEFDPKRVLIGETFVLDLEQMATYYGSGTDELNLCFNFPFALAQFDMDTLREIVETSDKLIPPDAWPVWFASNHDVLRYPTRWCEGDPAKVRAVLLMLLTLRGTALLYYGDEIGMTHPELSLEDVQDPVGKRHRASRPGRDPGRTPMHWSAEPGAGFTAPSAKPWLPLGDYEKCNVEDQWGDPSSMLCLCRDLVALRKRSRDLRRGAYERVELSGIGWAWRRGASTLVAMNWSDGNAAVDGVSGRILISTNRARDGHEVTRGIELAPWEAVVMEAPRDRAGELQGRVVTGRHRGKSVGIGGEGSQIAVGWRGS